MENIVVEVNDGGSLVSFVIPVDCQPAPGMIIYPITEADIVTKNAKADKDPGIPSVLGSYQRGLIIKEVMDTHINFMDKFGPCQCCTGVLITRIFIQIKIKHLPAAYFERKVETLPKPGERIKLTRKDLFSDGREGILEVWGDIAVIGNQVATQVSIGKLPGKSPCYAARLVHSS